MEDDWPRDHVMDGWPFYNDGPPLYVKRRHYARVAPLRRRTVLTLRPLTAAGRRPMIRKLSRGKYRLYSRKINPKTGKRRNLGTFDSRKAAEQHERDIQYFKRH